MAWEKCNVEQQRLLMVNEFLLNNDSVTNICKKYNISRKTGYKWYERYLQDGEEGLKDIPKSPNNHHTLYSKEIFDTSIDLKLKHRKWGPKKILVKLEELHPHKDWPSPTRLYEVFKEHHLVTKKRIRHRVPATAPLGHIMNCNDTWAMDFKGWFLTGDGTKCEPLTITDCVSRYLIKCVHLSKHTVEYVWPVFEEAFREYGLPNRIRSDNGPPFGSVGIGRLTRLGVNFIKAGVIPEWIDPGCPEQNGRHERFHLTLKQHTASPPQNSLIQQIQAMREFQEEYNFERPHEALGMKTPGSYYKSSTRSWDGVLRPPEYDTKEMEVRKVGQNGSMCLKNVEYYVGEALGGEYVGLKMNTENNAYELFYGPIYLGKINERGLEKPKMKQRIKR